jgi:hypothetical protein
MYKIYKMVLAQFVLKPKPLRVYAFAIPTPPFITKLGIIGETKCVSSAPFFSVL